MNNSDTLGALTGDVITQTGNIAENAVSFLIAFVENLMIRQFDAFGPGHRLGRVTTVFHGGRP